MPNNIDQVTWPGWEIVGIIGQGSFGTVYEIQRDVYGDIEKAALKVITIPHNKDEVDYLRCSGMDDCSITQTFHQQVGDIAREYKLMVQMRENPNIVRCDDFRDIPHNDGLGWDIYIKMELLTPLMKALDQVKTEDQIIRLGKELCNALIACQGKNIIHRDIKPQNVFVSDSGYFKLGDFGIARTVEQTTRATAGIGTYSFMAPEVEKNEAYGKTVDIYSLGLLLYWLLNECRSPFVPLPPAALKYSDEDEARRRRFSGEPLPAPAHGSEELKEIVLKACAYDPRERSQSALEMMEALESLNTGASRDQHLQAETCTPVSQLPNGDQTVGPRWEKDQEIAEAVPDEGTVGPDYRQPENAAIKTRKISKGNILIFSLAAVAVILVFSMLILGQSVKKDDRIFPNVFISSCNVGGMMQEEAVSFVRASVTEDPSIQVQLPDRVFSIDAEKAGVVWNIEEAVQEAFSYGKEGNAISVLAGYAKAHKTATQIALSISEAYDAEYIRSCIDQFAAESAQMSVASEVDYDETNRVLTVTVGYPEIKLDTDALYEKMCAAIENGDFSTITWNYIITPCKQVNLSEYYEALCVDAQDAEYDEESHSVLSEMVGYAFDLDTAQTSVSEAAPGSQIKIQIEEVEPDITQDELIHEMFGEELHTASILLRDDSEWVWNQELACKALNGMIINAGETFSFNDALGERSSEKGYIDADGDNQDSISQVSSALYKASLCMGFEQVERHNFRYAYPYLELGMDAEVSWPGLDYVFINTSSYPVKIQAYVENGFIYITFWGVKENDQYIKINTEILEVYPFEEIETIDVTKPVGYREQTEKPYTGYKIATYRTVCNSDGTPVWRELEAISIYEARDSTYIVGPEDEDSRNAIDAIEEFLNGGGLLP